MLKKSICFMVSIIISILISIFSFGNILSSMFASSKMLCVVAMIFIIALIGAVVYFDIGLIESNWKKTRGKSILILPVSLIFLLFLYAPLELYLNNQMEFWFDIYTLFPTLLEYGVLSIIFFVFVNGVIYKYSKSFSKWLFLLEFTIYIVLYFQGTLFTANLPSLDGTGVNWSDYSLDSLISIILVLVVVSGVFLITRLWKEKLFQIINTGCILITLILLVTLLTLVFTQDGLKHRASTTVTDKGELVVSSTDNYLILVLDHVDSRLWRSVVDANSEYRETLRDFTYYPDMAGAYFYTELAVPHIISGERYLADEPFEDYAIRAYDESDLVKMMAEDGYQVGLYEPSFPTNSSLEFENRVNEAVLSSKISLIKKELDLVGFRYMPFFLKRYFIGGIGSFDTIKETNTENQVVVFDDSMKMLYDKLDEFGLQLTKEKCFRWIHVDGAHRPYTMDKNLNIVGTQDGDSTEIEEVEASVRFVSRYLEMLRSSGVYDDSAIIIMADHGSEPFRQNPLFLVKGYGESHAYQVNDKPASYDGLQTAFCNLKNGVSGDAIFNNVSASDDGLRYVYLNKESEQENEMREYVVDGHAWEDADFYETGKKYSYER